MKYQNPTKVTFYVQIASLTIGTTLAVLLYSNDVLELLSKTKEKIDESKTPPTIVTVEPVKKIEESHPQEVKDPKDPIKAEGEKVKHEPPSSTQVSTPETVSPDSIPIIEEAESKPPPDVPEKLTNFQVKMKLDKIEVLLGKNGGKKDKVEGLNELTNLIIQDKVDVRSNLHRLNNCFKEWNWLKKRKHRNRMSNELRSLYDVYAQYGSDSMEYNTVLKKHQIGLYRRSICMLDTEVFYQTVRFY